MRKNILKILFFTVIIILLEQEVFGSINLGFKKVVTTVRGIIRDYAGIGAIVCGVHGLISTGWKFSTREADSAISLVGVVVGYCLCIAAKAIA